MAKAKTKKAKRYTAEQKKEILEFITNEGRGGQTKAVSKFGVTAATIASWRRKEGGISLVSGGGDGSKKLLAIEELGALLKEISAAETNLDKLRKEYMKVKAKI